VLETETGGRAAGVRDEIGGCKNRKGELRRGEGRRRGGVGGEPGRE